MDSKVKAIKEAIKNGTYDLEGAINTLAEKATLIHETYGSVWGIKLSENS